MLAGVDVFAPGGALERAHAAYEDRPSQRRMADAVSEAIADDRPLLIEAGTGTGKTLAYLIPALACGKRVVISTGTKALQEQLAGKDLSLLGEVSTTAVRAAVLKGTNNYVCQRRLALAATGSADEATGDDLSLVLAWISKTEVGDRAELGSVAENAAVWKQITTAADGRLGPKCPYIDRCFVAKARKRAERSDLIIVNHHLFFTDFALRRRGFGARVLPDYDVVIFDEAHQLEDIIATHLGPSLSSRGVNALAAELERDEDSFVEKRLIDWLKRCADSFFALVSSRAPKSAGGRADIPAHLFADPDVRESWLQLDTALDETSEAALLRASIEVDPMDVATLQSAALRAQSMRDAAAEIAEPEEPPCGQWIESSASGVTLCAAPASAGAILSEVVAQAKSVIFTSATLTTEDSFVFVRRRLGLAPESVEAIALASPFDYAEQALLYAARDLPEPNEPGFTEAVAMRMLELTELSGGGAFGLFTSWRALGEAATLLRAASSRTVLVQGDAPKAALIDRFRDDGDAILLATASFWEGVDVAGPSLRCVMIDRLPFVVPTDPLHRARMKRIEETGGDPFVDYQLPSAALHLKQGFGRLIRSRSDRGVVAVLDKRLVSRRYGRAFIETLPNGLPRTSAVEQVRRFFDAGGKE